MANRPYQGKGDPWFFLTGLTSKHTPFGATPMGSIIQGGLSFLGQRQTNEQNQEDFLSNQQFSAAQAQDQRTFEANQQLQAEAYNTEMSDTSMQRRVQDLNAAGLNPLLAIGAGGASTPTMSAPGGATAGAPGLPNIQNALGAGVQSAQQAEAVQAQADAASAQAKKTTSETPTPDYSPKMNDDGELEVPSGGHELGDAMLKSIQANTGVATQTAKQVMANIGLINANVNNTNSNTALNNIQAALAGQKLSILQATSQYLIQQEAAEGAQSKNIADIMGGKYGPTLQWIETLLKPISSAAGAVSHFIP